MARSQTISLSLVLLIATVVAVSTVVAMSVKTQGPEGPAIPTWPSFTMLYETTGITYARGSSQIETTREVRRLEYQSATQWTETVVEAPTINTPVGPSSRVGFSTRLDGDSYTEFNASGESTYTDTVGENTMRIVGSMPPPFPIKELGVATESTTTSAKVCFHDECTENAAAVLYRKANGSELVFLDDARGIPLRVNDTFVVKEININDAKQEIPQ